MPELLRPLPPRSWRDRCQAAVDTVRSSTPAAWIAIGAVVLAIVVGAGVVVARRARGRAGPPASVVRLPRAGEARAGDAASAGGPVDGADGMLVVHAAGAVLRPGVYRVAAGSRVNDVVTAAGGPAPDADLDQLDLAAKVGDGDRVYVPRRGEAAGTPGAGASGVVGAPLDLNRATIEQLDALPGVGPATARAIVDWRTRHGRFRSVQDLLDVPGIGPAKLDRLRPMVTVR